jgi:glycosyltransferase involved in cell wall biosynthesis
MQTVAEDNNKKPLVTVLLPVYNAEAHLAEAIQSILSQTFRDFELLIINDGSTDRSAQVIASFKDERIRLVNNESNHKLIATLNKGFDLARGKYIARMDADDISLPQRLQRQFDFMESHSEVGICGSWFRSFGTHSTVVKYPEKDEDIRVMMLYQIPFSHPTVMLRREVVEKHHIRFLPEFIHAEDYEAWVRLIPLTKFANLPEVLLQYRLHEQSVSASYRGIQEKNTYKIISKVFENAGMRVSDEEIKLFREVAYAGFKAEKEFIERAESILRRLVESNDRTHYLPDAALKKFIFEKWFHLCYNTTSLGRWVYDYYHQSHLSGLGKLPLKRRLNFRFKTLA